MAHGILPISSSESALKVKYGSEGAKNSQVLRTANEIKRVYTSCIITQKIRYHYNAT
jgi:hypothetical protein